MSQERRIGVSLSESSLTPLIGQTLNARVLAYGNDPLVQEVKVDSTDFAGLIGLPFLRMMEYGGNIDWFWIRLAQASGTSVQP